MEENEEILENIEEVLEEPTMEISEEVIMPKSDEEMVEDYLKNLERNNVTFFGTMDDLIEELMLPFPTVNEILNKWENDEKINKYVQVHAGEEDKFVILFK